ncbi:hypothetical protein PFISCL1PPCAC_13000, partial [Pristionchus fissidentatus]
MVNLTLSDGWHSFMPVYQHHIALTTHAISAIALYLMITKTPPSGRPFARYLICLQLSIVSADLNFGLLGAPTALYPIPCGLCNGFLCTVFGFSGHAVIMLMFFTVAYTGVSIIYCFHYKFVTILAMICHRPVESTWPKLFRISIFILFTIPCILQSTLHRSLEGGPAFVSKSFPTLFYLFEDTEYQAFAYDFGVEPRLAAIFASATI